MDWEIDSKWTKKSSKWILSPVLVWKLFKLWKLFNWKTCSWIQTTLNVQQLLFEFDFSIFRTVFLWNGRCRSFQTGRQLSRDFQSSDMLNSNLRNLLFVLRSRTVHGLSVCHALIYVPRIKILAPQSSKWSH